MNDLDQFEFDFEFGFFHRFPSYHHYQNSIKLFCGASKAPRTDDLPALPRLRGDLIDRLRKAKVSTLEELKGACIVGTKLKSEDFLYEIFEVKGELVRAKILDMKTGRALGGNRNFNFSELWAYFQEERLSFAE